MRHRHLIDSAGRSLPAIDDVIERGRWSDWVSLREDCIGQPELLDGIERVCAPRIADPYAQRHHFWMSFVRQRRAAA